MTGINSRSGGLNGLAVSRNPTASVDALIHAVEDLMSEMEGVVTPNEVTGRARFPGFTIQPVISGKIASVVEELKRGNIEVAWETFDNARMHFTNQQAAFARDRLLGNLVHELNCAEDARCDGDLIAKIRQTVEAYSNLVAPATDGKKVKYFDLGEASRLFWIAFDTIVSAKEEFHGRRRAREAQEARCALQTACSSGAERLKQRIARQCAVLGTTGGRAS